MLKCTSARLQANGQTLAAIRAIPMIAKREFWRDYLALIMCLNADTRFLQYGCLEDL